MKKKKIFPSLIIIIGCIILASTVLVQQMKNSKQHEQILLVKKHKERLFLHSSHSLTEKITIGAIGDILIHQPVYEDAYTSGKYNFNPMLANVKGMLEGPDFVTANQESILGGRKLGISSYPRFNSPQEIADALKSNGVDMVSTANNHSLDKGEQGLLAETAYLNHIGLPYVGSYASQQDKEKIRLVNKNGIKLAFLSYTYGTNGIPIPKGKDYLVNLIDQSKMKNDIQRARKAADIVVMSIHWGNEYQRIPTKAQKELAQFLANEGVDIIFGSHPHVLQPMEWIKTNTTRKTFIVYSLGNFLSGQNGDYKDIGGLATIDIKKNITSSGTKVELSNPAFYPTFVANQKCHQYRVVPLEKAANYGLSNAAAKYQEIKKHMFQWLK